MKKIEIEIAVVFTNGQSFNLERVLKGSRAPVLILNTSATSFKGEESRFLVFTHYIYQFY